MQKVGSGGWVGEGVGVGVTNLGCGDAKSYYPSEYRAWDIRVLLNPEPCAGGGYRGDIPSAGSSAQLRRILRTHRAEALPQVHGGWGLRHL